MCVQTATSRAVQGVSDASSFSPIKKLGKHSTNQECHYFRLNTGTVSTKKKKKQLHKQEDALSESTLTLNGKLLPLCIQRAPESFQTIISASSHVKSTCGTVHLLSCPVWPGLNVQYVHLTMYTKSCYTVKLPINQLLKHNLVWGIEKSYMKRC